MRPKGHVVINFTRILYLSLGMELVEWLVRADRHGYRGKQYPIADMDEIIIGV